ncbi:Hypothetical_protein [Hexamita inflata]|uniref:Hypothetical_protein n=1 Tax=Hexamita inflata TaxID=28002 RepID=A0AA86PEG4_9EUKA|nr:Hypothetical protein HINF_LOCUS22240 [Hexamita inflata]
MKATCEQPTVYPSTELVLTYLLLCQYLLITSNQSYWFNKVTSGSTYEYCLVYSYQLIIIICEVERKDNSSTNSKNNNITVIFHCVYLRFIIFPDIKHNKKLNLTAKHFVIYTTQEFGQVEFEIALPEHEEPKENKNQGWIVWVVVTAILVAIAVIAVLVFFYVKHKKNQIYANVQNEEKDMMLDDPK